MALTVALLCIPLNVLLLTLAGWNSWEAIFDPRRIPGLLVLVAVALGVGQLGDLIRRLRDSERDYRGLLDQVADAIFADDGCLPM